MGIASTLVGAAIKTGVNVATDLLNDQKLPVKGKHGKNKHPDDHKHSNHTTRAIDNGSQPPAGLKGYTTVQIQYHGASGPYPLGMNEFFCIFACVIFVLLAFVLLGSICVALGKEPPCGDVESQNISSEEGNARNDEQPQQEQSYTSIPSDDLDATQNNDRVSTVLKAPKYVPWDAPEESGPPCYNLTENKSSTHETETSMPASTGIWIVENDTGLRYE